MAKQATATENATAEATETKDRAKAGSSVSAQAKQLVRAISLELANGGEIMADTLEWLNKLASEIGAGAVRGVPLETRLAEAEAELAALYNNVDVVDGKPQFGADFAQKTQVLMNRIARIKNDIKKGTNTADEADGAGE